MARPQKEGLDYFSLDVDMDQDDKILLVEAKHKIIGFAIVVKLLMKIYKEGYFYKWTEREQLLLSSRINVDVNTIKEVVSDCIKWEFFNTALFEKYSILTSSGIQKRYFDAIKRRKEINLISEYLVIAPPESSDKFTVKIVSVDKNTINVDINSIKEGLIPTLIPKVKESIVKDSTLKVEDDDDPQPPPPKKEIEIKSNTSGAAIILFERDVYGRPITGLEAEMILETVDEYGFDIVKEATKTAIALGSRNIKYIQRILGGWRQKGLKSLSEIQEHEVKRDKAKLEANGAKDLTAKVPKNLTSGKDPSRYDHFYL